MIKNVLKKYRGLIFLYLVIIGMCFLVNERFSELKRQESNLVFDSIQE